MPTSKSWVEKLVRDIVPFADPNPNRDAVTVEQFDDVRVRLAWNARGRALSRVFILSNDKIRVTDDDGGSALDLAAFLAGAEMADVLRMADMTLAVLPDEYYLASNARCEDEAPQLALPLIESLIAADSDTTRLLFVTANAGGGKSRVLRRLARTRAEACRSGKFGSLFLYVDAQGRALARLDEAIAIAFADLRSHVHYSALAALVRFGVIVPIIDGFDELLETAAVDSMSSLSRFLDDLEGEGKLIACARSAFYEQEFARRAQGAPSKNQSWTVQRVEIVGWDKQQQEQLVRERFRAQGKAGEDTAVLNIRASLDRVDSSGIDLAKPFFVDALCNLFLDRRNVSSGAGVGLLVDAYVAREVDEKFLDKDGKSLLSAEKLKQILTTIAYEMWLSETRSLTIGIVSEIMNTHDVGEFVDAKLRDPMVQRGRVLACLQASGEARVEFEHELFFDYFVACELADRVNNTGDLPWMLACSSCSQSMADMTVKQAEANGLRARELVSLFGKVVDRTHSRAELIRENAGRLVAAALRRLVPEVKDLVVENVAFVDENFRDFTFSGCEMRRVLFRGCALENTVFRSSRFFDTDLERVRVSMKSTRFEVEGLDVERVRGLNVVDDGGMIFRLDVVAEKLRACGASFPHVTPSGPGVRGDVMNLLERLANTFRQTNVIWPQDDKLSWLRNDPAWPNVRSELLHWRIIEFEPTYSQNGQPRERYRGRVGMGEVLAASAPNARATREIVGFWSALRKAFPVPN